MSVDGSLNHTPRIDPRRVLSSLLDETTFELAANGVRITTVRGGRTFSTVLLPDDALRLADAIDKRYRG